MIGRNRSHMNLSFTIIYDKHPGDDQWARLGLHGTGTDRRCRIGSRRCFARRWSGAGQGQKFDFVRIVESADKVIVTYKVTKAGGSCGRNTEIFTFSGNKIRVVEVYFGWTIH
jgi:hypothetical protein